MKSLKNYREALNLTQQQLADKAGVHSQTIFKVENQHVEPTADVRRSIEIAIQSRVNWLASCSTDNGKLKNMGEALECDLREVMVNAKQLDPVERKQFMAVAREYVDTMSSIVVLMEEDEDLRFLLPLDRRIELRDKAEGFR